MKFKREFSLFIVLIIILVSFYETLACECNESDICNAYSKAEKVFIGKLEKVEKDEKAPVYSIQAHFSVEKTYKGKTEKIEIVTFKLGDCEWLNFIEGEKYFVYSNKLNINTYCSKTKFLKFAKTDIEYANSLSEKYPIFTIKGFLPQIDSRNPNLLKQIKLYLKFATNRRRIKIDKDGFFSFVVRKKGKYEISISLPFKAEVYVLRSTFDVENSAKVSTLNDSTKIQYEVEFRPNECDYREIRVVKN